MKDYNSIINFKYGSEPFNVKNLEGLSSSWFFYKPNIGNTSPSLVAPFSGLSSVIYSDGYPTGYNKYKVSTNNLVLKTIKKNCVIGITHFNHNGTGYIKNFYNYFLIKPSNKPTLLIDEKHNLDSYYIKTKKYELEAKMATNNITYNITSNDTIMIIPGYEGITTKNKKPLISNCTISKENNVYLITVDYIDKTIYYALRIDCDADILKDRLILKDNKATIKLAYSLLSLTNSVNNLINNDSISNDWAYLLDVIDIQANEKVTKTFYSALYDSLKKPFISYEDNSVYDLATLWDMYKYQLPLIFLFYQDKAKLIVEGLANLYDENGYFHNARLITNKVNNSFDNQSICIANILLSTANLYKVDYDFSSIIKKQINDIDYQINKDLPRLPRFTYNLDLADSIYALNNVKYDLYDTNKIDNLYPKLFDSDGVYLLNNKKTKYYEGSNVNYSFRVGASTFKRLEFTNLNKLGDSLDYFFGFTSNKIKPITNYVKGKARIKLGNKLARFEGLNNEPDMESPFMYGLINKYEKQNKLLNEILNKSFNYKDSGLAGNDDSGGLSSFYVFNSLGLNPIVGTNKLLIGLPLVNKATINLKNRFEIEVNRVNENSIYLDSVYLNNSKLDKYEITINDVLVGGKLVINLK